MSDTIFVTGAAGKLGSAVIAHLLGREGVAPSRIVAGTRDPGRLASLAAQGVRVAKADFDDAAGLEAALKDAGTLLIISTDALDGAGTRLRQHKAAVAAAAKAGVGRIAYTSLPVPETSHISFAPDHLNTEMAIAATGLPHTIFRNNWYQENLLMNLPQAFAGGRWYSAAGSGRTAHASRDDMAAAIAATLANPPAGNATFTLTGSEALTHEEIAALASPIVGKPLEVVHVTDEQLAGGMKAAGLPDFVIPTFVSFDTAARAGDLGLVTSDLAMLAGRPLRSLAAFFEENRAAFAGA